MCFFFLYIWIEKTVFETEGKTAKIPNTISILFLASNDMLKPAAKPNKLMGFQNQCIIEFVLILTRGIASYISYSLSQNHSFDFHWRNLLGVICSSLPQTGSAFQLNLVSHLDQVALAISSWILSTFMDGSSTTSLQIQSATPVPILLSHTLNFQHHLSLVKWIFLKSLQRNKRQVPNHTWH